MKVEIDLDEILHDDDYGTETLQESIKRQVIEKIKAETTKGISQKIDTEISKMINQEISDKIKAITPTLFADLLDAEYVMVDRWGDRQNTKTTFRKELIKKLNEEAVYKKSSYESDKNAFTKAVDSVMEEQFALFKKEFIKKADELYLAETMKFAVETLQKRLGLIK